MDYLGTRGICFICKNKEKKEDGKYHCISENGFTGCEIDECIVCCPGFREDKDKKIETLQALNRDFVQILQKVKQDYKDNEFFGDMNVYEDICKTLEKAEKVMG